MEKQWRRYVVFISSTFKDMDSERDIIKFHVIPALNRLYRNRMVEIQAIDLRLGIDTTGLSESESENKILDVCTACIESARPFFIGLLGDRYGWIPSGERWHDFIARQLPENRDLLVNTLGRSVTEMEIVFGALGKADSVRSLFFMRDETSYRNMPASMRAQYRDEEDSNQSAEQRQSNVRHRTELKESILRTVGRCGDTCFGYHLDWEDYGWRQEGLNMFGNLVQRQLAIQIDKELDADNSQSDTWQGQEQINLSALINRYTQRKISRREKYPIVKNRPTLYTGPEGCGKSVILAQHFVAAKADAKCVALYADVASSPHSLYMRQIMVRWICELCDFANDAKPDSESLLSVKNTPMPRLYEYFYECVSRANEAGFRVVVFMDGIERFAGFSPEDMHLTWLDKRIEFVGCINQAYVESVTRHNMQLEVVRICPPDNDELMQIISQFERDYLLELPPLICKELRQGALMPLFLRVLFVLFSSLDADDFRKIRASSGEPIEAINKHLYGLFHRIPRENNLLLSFLLQMLSVQAHVEPEICKAFEYLALAPCGLRESDLEKLLGAKWSALDFYTLANLSADFLFEDSSQHHWRIASVYMRDSLVDGHRRKSMFNDIAETMSRYDDDPEKERSWAYYILKAERADLAARWLTSEELCFDRSAAMRVRYRLPIAYLRGDSDFYGHVYNVATELDANRQVSFLATLLISGLYDYAFSDSQIVVSVMDSVLSKIDLCRLTLPRLYEFATIYKELLLIGTHITRQDSEILMRYGEMAADGFRRCYEISPYFRDARNLLVAMLTNLIPLYAEKGDFEAMERAYAETQSLF